MTHPNPSTALARVLVDELARHGVDFAVISPGSRSAALAIAFDEHPAIQTRVVLDERSAAFWALGRSRATGVPAVVVATSGTAVANHLPAVIEADQSMVPLIVVSADRPPEALHIGANQTIDQERMFEGWVRWSCNLGPGDVGIDQAPYWRGSVSQAVARSTGHGMRPGPVHLNIAFREPTVPVTDDGRTVGLEYPHSTDGRPDGSPWQAHSRAPAGPAPIPSIGVSRGVVIAGEGEYQRGGLIDAAARLGWPILATALSGLRGNDVVTTYHHLLVAGVPPRLTPEVVLTVGRAGPSDRLGALTAVDCPQIAIDRWGAWNDPRRQSTMLAQGDPVATLQSMAETVRVEPTWAGVWFDAGRAMREALDETLVAGGEASGPGVARALSASGWQTLVTASSMPVRDVDAHLTKGGDVVANRGASGIDGLVSTALGVASARSGTLALSGDLSMLHDASGLIADQLGDVVLVVVDNNGGGLFDLLPQAEHAPEFERLFVAPHHRDLVALLEAAGVSAERVDAGALAGEVDLRLSGGGAHALVVPVDREADLKLRRALDETARSLVTGLS